MRFPRIASISALTALTFFFGLSAHASHCGSCDALTSVIGHVLETVNIFIGVFFVLGVALFGWGVAKLIYAAGDPTKIQQAKQFIWWGIIGMGILAMIGGILNWLAAYMGINPNLEVDVLVPRVQ